MNDPASSAATAGTASSSAPLPLDAVLATDELAKRPSRPPNHDVEARALHAITRAASGSAIEALEALMREAVTACRADGAASAGVSLLEDDPSEGQRFRWAAVAGRLAPLVGGTRRRELTPCGVCLAHDGPSLFRRPDLHFRHFLETGIPFVEMLVVPFYAEGAPAGAVWVVSHDGSRAFDAEDARLMTSLAEATSVVYTALRAREHADAERRHLAESEAAFRAVQDASPDASMLCVAVRDHTGAVVDFEIVYANAAVQKVLRPRGPVVGRTVREAFPDAAVRGRVSAYARTFETGEPLQQEHFYEQDGERYGVRVTAVRVGEGVHIAFADLTDRLHAAEERERLLREAEAARIASERANRAKGEFLAALSHEVRTPLNAIAGYVDLMEMGLHGPVSSEQRAALSRIRHNQRHLLQLVTDVLSFSRMEAGKIEYHVEPVRLADVVAEVRPIVETQIATKGLAYAEEVAADRVVYADREKLKQVLVNLLSNATKFTPPGGRVRVMCPKRADGSHPAGLAFLAVRDSGIGIPADKLEAVFEPFVQVDSSTAYRAAGAGLGLAISRDLARGMGGDLRARSEEGRGSTFTVALREAQ